MRFWFILQVEIQYVAKIKPNLHPLMIVLEQLTIYINIRFVMAMLTFEGAAEVGVTTKARGSLDR